MKRAFFAGLVLAALAAANLEGPRAAPDRDFCGTNAHLGSALDEFHQKNLDNINTASTLRQQLVGGLGDRFQGDVMVIEDMGDLVVGNVTDSAEILTRALFLAGDQFDFITILTASTFPGNVEPEFGFAFYLDIYNDIGGIGLPVGTPVTKLRGFINLNDLDEYPNGPLGTISGFNGVVTGIEVLGHETAHFAEAYIQSSLTQLLGRDDVHWNFYMQAHSSVMEGNLWIDNDDGTFTTAPGAQQFRTYSDLDLYLLGLLDPAEVVQPMWVIETPSENPGQGRFSFPAGGFTTSGTRVEITMADIIAVNGPRSPAFPTEDEWDMGFVLVVPFAQDPSVDDMLLVEVFRSTIESWFATHTRGRGTMNTAISLTPVGGDFRALPRGGPAPLTVEFQSSLLGNVSDVLWDFGDGETSAESNPQHSYLNDGTYTVTLTINGYFGPVVVSKQDYIVAGNFSLVLFDDFETDQGWIVDPLDSATLGRWELDDPEGTYVNSLMVQPEDDHTDPPGVNCYVTGALAGPSTGTNDVDGGATTLISPLFGVNSTEPVFLQYHYWYSNNLGPGTADDLFEVYLSNDNGQSWVRIQTVASSASRWRFNQIRVHEFLPHTGLMRVRFTASDRGDTSLVEAAVDDVAVIGLFRTDGDADLEPDGLDNCPSIYNPAQVDSDDDGRGDLCDCAPNDPSVNRRPGEVKRALVFIDQTTMRWPVEDQAVSYNVYRGHDAASLTWSYNYTCRAWGLTLPEYVELQNPPLNTLYYFLVTAENCFGVSSAGPASGGTVRPPATCP